METKTNTSRDPKQSRLFSLGKVVATPGALEALEQSGDSASSFLIQHVLGDWGDLCEEDKTANEDALQEGLRLLSSYRTNNGTKIWIITERDRSATTILLPSEY